MPPAPSLLERTFRPDERVALFIDGANAHGAAKALGIEMDYKRLLEAFKSTTKVVRASYYTAIIENEDFSPVRPLVDWLDYNGYRVVTKPAREYSDPTGRRRWKGDMDVDISVDMMEAAGWLDHAVLFSGDGDFVPLVEALQRRGVRISVVSTIKTSPPMASDELRRAADAFLDMVDLFDVLARPPRGDQG